MAVPATLPTSDSWNRIPRAIREILTGADNNDGEAIRYAVESRRTSTGYPHQGRGLPEIVRVPDEAQGGSVRIFSGRGSLTYDYGNAMLVKNERKHVGGTLIEWSIPCAPTESGDGDDQDD